MSRIILVNVEQFYYWRGSDILVYSYQIAGLQHLVLLDRVDHEFLMALDCCQLGRILKGRVDSIAGLLAVFCRASGAPLINSLSTGWKNRAVAGIGSRFSIEFDLLLP